MFGVSVHPVCIGHCASYAMCLSHVLLLMSGLYVCVTGHMSKRACLASFALTATKGIGPPRGRTVVPNDME